MINTCQHTDTEIEHDIGYDIDEEGDTRQHLEVCKRCGADRIISVHSKRGQYAGKWRNRLVANHRV